MAFCLSLLINSTSEDYSVLRGLKYTPQNFFLTSILPFVQLHSLSAPSSGIMAQSKAVIPRLFLDEHLHEYIAVLVAPGYSYPGIVIGCVHDIGLMSG